MEVEKRHGMFAVWRYKRCRRPEGASQPQRTSTAWSIRLMHVLALCIPHFCAVAASVEDGNLGSANPARDKRSFIVVASGLGASSNSDTDLLAALAGAPVQHQFKQVPFRDAPNRHEASAGFLAHDRLISSFNSVYSFHASGTYFSIIRFRFDQKFACVTRADLEDLLGPPARIPRGPPSAQIRSREGSIWATEYGLRTGANATFVFAYAPCASALNVAVNLKINNN